MTYSNRWDDRSDTPRSRSRSGERSVSEASVHSSQHRSRKEKKKSKRKKKSKKRKHSKKHKKCKPKDTSLSEGEMTGSSAKRSKHSSRPERRPRSRSYSRSTSPHSHRSYRSDSDRRRYSSYSSRDSQTYSRSRSRSRSYSRSHSRSDRRLRSPLRSSGSRSGRSVTQSRSLSRSRSRHRTRSRSGSNSRYRTSPHSTKKNLAKSPRISKATDGGKLDKSVPKAIHGDDTKTPPAASSENVSVLPLSDSPPPSRWKPGQKPWKPSYVNIQGITPKSVPSSDTVISPSANIPLETLSSLKPDTVLSQMAPNRSNNNVSDRLLQKSLSRSRSSSRSRGSSQSSSYSRSESYDSYRKSSEKKKHHRILKNNHKNMHKTKSNRNGNHSSGHKGTIHCSEDGSDSPHSPIHRHSDPFLSDHQTVTIKAKPLVDKSSKSGWESEGENSSKTNTAAEPNQPSVMDDVGLTEIKKRQILSRCWESESDSEMPDKMVGEAKHMSEKEEGEASSESEPEGTFWPLNKSNKGAEMSEELKNDQEHANADAKTIKRKSKKAKRKHKHKRRNSSRSGSRRSKNKKSKKHQKAKETFLWQPPLEFGDEGEEEDSVAPAKHIDHANPNAVNEGTKRRGKAERVRTHSSENKDEDHRTHESPQGKWACKGIDGKMARNPVQIQTHASHSDHANNQNRLKDQNQVGTRTPDYILDAGQPGPKAIGFSPLKNILNTRSALVPPPIEKENSLSIKSPDSQKEETSDTSISAVENKWKPLTGMTAVQAITTKPLVMKISKPQNQLERKAQGLKIEIKSNNRVRPGSLFDEVRKTARLNQRPRNQDSSSEEDSVPPAGERESHNHSRDKSRSVSSHRSHRRSRSRSYSHTRSRSRSYTYSSRSDTVKILFVQI